MAVCNTLTRISHRCTCVPHSKLPSPFPPHPIPLGCPSARTLSALFHAWNLDWSSILHMVIYMFQCYSLISSHTSLFHRVQKSVLYICVSFAVLHNILEKAMATHSSSLAWKIPWMEEPGRLQSMLLLWVGHNWAALISLFTFMHWRRKWQPTPVFLPGESQGQGNLVGCRLRGRTESDTTEVT